ncbi:DinB superfamily protein [Halobacillus dabanensis]|uniref:DinB superfamily protein n=1 Tax=Halobacillus dabanensis TaxID=240302 RepID=A0A1I3W9U3_HALDA|nr:DinB family protein [Halobacillus dabanensis]SFK04285.1 DinB superfamily protein [Halobacillus dabanensis]
MSLTEQYQQQIKDKVNTYLVVSNVSEEIVRWKPSEDEWSILQVHSHVNESLNFWIQDLVEAVDGKAKWGRTLKHEGRLKAVEDVEDLDIAGIRDEIDASKERVLTEIGKMDSEVFKQEKEHVNPKFGVKPLSFLVEHFIIEHIGKHITQVERNIANYKEKVHQ